MKPSQLFHALNGLLNVHLPAFILGPPGVGKSEVVAQLAAHRGVELRDVRLGLMDPTDIKGFPSPDHVKKLMTWLPPDFLPTKGKGILFLDELTSAPPAVQAASYQLVLNRAVGNYKLPPGWDILAAGNRDTDRAVVHRMSSALANRMIHLSLEPDLEEWVAYAGANGISLNTIAFLRFRSELLHKHEPNTKSHAFPTPRSWFFLDKIVQEAKMARDIEFEALKGTVGEGAAGEYHAFIRVVKDLPTIDDIRKAPDKITVPTGSAVLYAVTTMVDLATTKKDYAHFMKFVERLPKEYQVVYNRAVIKRVPEIKFDPVFTKWGNANHEVVVGAA